MPIFEYNGKKFNVKDEHIDSFMQEYPEASTIMEREGQKYRVRSADYKTFMSEQSGGTEERMTGDNSPSRVEGSNLGEQSNETRLRQIHGIVEGFNRRTAQSMDEFNERMENLRERGDNASFGYDGTVEGRMMFNPQSGKMEQTYITPLGDRTTSRWLADAESLRYRLAADMSVNGQLRRARLRLAELQRKKAAARDSAHDRAQEFNETKLTGFGQIMAGPQIYQSQVASDPATNAYDTAIHETEALIARLERAQSRENGEDSGFWSGLGTIELTDFDFGLGEMQRSMTKMGAEHYTGANATEGEREAYNEMLMAMHENEQSEQIYPDSWWFNMGVMTKDVAPFALDFLLFNGATSLPTVFTKGGARIATKVVGKEIVEDMVAQGFKTYIKNNGVRGLGQYATNWTIKALGTVGDDLLIRAPLMTNSVQLGKTTADIIDRKLGDVVENEDGTYDFSNDKTWGSAIWQGEANAIIENFSEMFGAHLDPVVTLGNMSKLANVVGAKRLGAVLSKADAGALSGIMGQTHQLFNKMGVSDYFGEVAEEYYGQLWRTMLNLDDAYQQNPDGTRTNLFATGQFHGDIWGGMALSMGLMGAGKHTLSGAQYMSMKHSVNKANAHATELLGKEVWEPLRATIDLTTNDDIGSVAEGIVNDKDFTDDERAAVLTYMERMLMLRGFNLGTLAQKRGTEPDEDLQTIDESYINGYNISNPQEMTDAKNLYAYQRQRIIEVLGVNDEVFNDESIDWLNELRTARNNGDNNKANSILDYLSAKQVYNGMIQRVRDDIDGRVAQSNAMVNARTNRTTGMIQGATMKTDKRKVYVINGNLVQYADGSGIDIEASDNSIIVRDAETGALEQVSPDAILNIDEALDPITEMQTAADAIRQQYAQEAANRIDGVVTFNPGDTYTITGDDAQIQVQIVANDEGIVDNGDGTVNVSDGTNIFPLAKETIQQQAEAAQLARVAQFEQQRAAENAAYQQAIEEESRPQYALNDLVSLRDENGNAVRGNITTDADADGRYEVYTEAPINGKRVNLFTRDELDSMLMEHNGVVIEQPAENEGNNGGENIPENIPENGNIAPQNIPAMQRIPKDMQGNPLYEQTDSDTAWDAIVEQTEGDEAMAQTVADGMVADKEAALKKLEKAKSKGGATVAEKIAAEKERKAAIDAAQQEVNIWKKIAGTANRRRMDAEAERRRVAEEAAALRKAEEAERLGARIEAERIEREALNGVPDMVDDTPQDARARGYRRVSGHKIDRQEPLQAVQGKEVAVRFSDDAIANGRVAVIDAAQLQPSHIQGQRNPLHFIDEAQPKERNDEASVMSARKIAGNIRPEEITSSVTAYTGAPTVNTRGEAIQGNNRSDALRLMWESHQDQAAQYKQYLIDHAEEFGLNADDVAAMERPVLVNMLDVDDAEAITLGQFVAQDTESGGTERIKPKNALQKMGNDMRSFANLLLKSNDDDTSFAGLVDNNGVEVLKWMSQRGYITPTQYKSAFDSKGNLTAEAKNDLRGIMYQSIFKGGSTRLEEMFNAMPAKAQKAILATAFRDYDSPNADRMIEEIQNSIRAFYALSQSEDFVNAKTFKDARLAVEGWKIQYQIDDVTGESYLPAENFSNFALLLATMYKGENQSVIQGTFNKLYDLIQGTQEPNLFEQPDNTPRSLAQAIYETLNITYDGQQRSNVLVGDSSASQRGQQGSTGDAATGERIESGERTADSAGSIDGDNRGIRSEQENRGNQGEETHIPQTEEVDEYGNHFVLASDGTSNFGVIDAESGLKQAPIKLSMGDNTIDENGESHGYGLLHIEASRGEAIRNAGYASVQEFIESVAKNYTDIREGGIIANNQTYLLELVDEHNNTLFIQLSKNGEYWTINSAGIFRKKYSRNKRKVYDRPAIGSDTNTDISGVDSGHIDGVTTPAGNSPQTSEGKDTTNSPISNELEEKNVHSTIGEQVQAAEAEVNTNPTEKQKEAGNYKKGHVQIRFARTAPARQNTSDVGAKPSLTRSFGTFNVTIEQPKGSVRSGVDKGGKKWEVEMQNTYGYIRGTEGVDGDHIDVFLSDDIDGWNGRQVFVVDQRNADGSFDEHKVMLGFNDINDAEAAYLSNYEEGWQGLGAITGVAIEEFEKWIASSHRKTKAFGSYSIAQLKGAEYKSVKTTEGQSASADKDLRRKLADFNVGDVVRDYYNQKLYRIKKHSTNGVSTIAELDAEGNEVGTTTMNAHNNSRYSLAEAPVKAETPTISQESEQVSDQDNAPYTIAPAQYTTKKGKVLDMHLVKFAGTLTKEQQRAAKELAKAEKGWYDREQGGFMMRSEESAKQLADTILNNDDAVSDAQPVSLADTRKVIEPKVKSQSKQGIPPHSASGTMEELGEVTGSEPQVEATEAVVAYTKHFSGAKDLDILLLNSEEDAIEYAMRNGDTLEQARDGIEFVKSRSLAGGFEPGTNKISIFAFINENIYAMLFHEHIHYAVEQLGGIENFKALTDDLRDIDPELERSIIKRYSSDDVAEEMITYSLEAALYGDAIEELRAELSAEAQQQLEQILNKTGYEQGRSYQDEVARFEQDPNGSGLGRKRTRTRRRIARRRRRLGGKKSRGRDILQGVDKETPSAEKSDGGSGSERLIVGKYPSGNRLVTDERYAELRERMRKKLGGQMNVGIDPEILAIGTEMAVYHLEKGARKFTEYAKAMIADLGDAIRPYLKAFYNGARNLPEVEGSEIAADMTPYDEVQQFNVATFDKEHSDPFTTAEIVVAEQAHQEEAEQAKQEIINQRNTERRNEDEQTSASTEAIASQTETVADKAESDIETATTEEQLNDVVATIDKQIEEVNKQLALLGYYEADIDDSQFHESYGYMRSAEKKAVKDADTLAKRIVKDLGIDPASIVDKKGKKRKVIAQANIAPAGGDVSIRLPLTASRELYIDVLLEPDYEGGNRDNLFIDHIYLRIEDPTAGGYKQFVGRNVWVQSDATYTDMLDEIRAEIIQHVPEFDLPTRQSVSETEQKQPKAKKSKKKAVNLQQSNELGLFDSLFDNETNNEDGLQRTDATRSEGVSANGNRHEQGLSRGTETGSESEQQDSRRTDNGGKRTGDAVDRTVRPRLSDTVTEKKNTHNNHSERGKDHAPTSVDARIDANIKAIELAKQLLESGEKATEKQMQTLRKFSGWGGLGKAFSEGTYYAPNPIAKQLRELLGEEAYQQAVMSANSAYYTPAYVVDTLWDIAEQMGFKGGNILEGSAGIGNILGQMPTHISERSDIHAIEIDGTSGGILSLLYPDAKVEIQGFEETRIANGSVDLAITNVPFVTGLRVNDTTGDKDLSKKFHNIHDFCIAKNVRKLREGGLGIFITSNGTLDSSKKLRDWIVSEGGADFVGAFRMHNKTFGGTGVTSDIIVIRKRVNGKKSANAIDVSTVTGERMAEYETGETRKVKGKETPVIKQLSMDYNRYFVEHPENMAGEMHFAFEKGDTFRPTSKGLYPKQDKKQEQMLAEFVQSFTAEEFGDKATDSEDVIDAIPGKKIGEVFVKDGKLYINAIGAAQPLEVNANKVKGHTKVECFEAYSAIKEALAAVLEYQINHEDDKGLKPLLAKLNKVYDDFVATYGHFNKNTAIAFLRNDVDYANVFALEKFEESADAKGNKVQKFGKTDVFSKRVIEKEAEPMPTNVKDGIIASIFKFGRVDVPYIAEQLGKSEYEVKAEIIESGYGFEDPATRQVEVSYQYLSGNVREKLRQAQENNENGEFDRNIKALQEVMPMTIPAHLIDFTLGSSWIEPKMYEEYVKERTEVGVQFTAVGGTWFMNEPYFTNYEKNRAMGVTSEMLGRTVMGHTLIEAAIQNRTITVSTTKKNWDGSTETITDKEATQACSAKIDEIRQDFKEWARQKMQSDAEMSERMERVYNDTFNNYVPMSIPDEFVPEYFGGASHKFKMRSHQGRAIVRGTMQPLLLAHEVGTGKTFTLISTAMEMRRLGTARKPMIVVQNATVGQFVASAKELYPNAKILTLEEADRSADGRKNFYAKIKYNDWDMIVVPQSTFEFIPDSEERQMAFVQEKIEEKMLVLEQMKEADPDGKSMITRQAEREIALLEEELAGLSGETGKKRTANDEKKRAVALQNAEVKAMEMLDRRTDDVENFDDMGIDALLIDEAHEYKHLGFATAMQRGVKGVDPSYSKKSQGVFLKTQAVLEKNNGRNVIFATGTPISNTAAEIWTFMRYLMPADTMKEYGIYYFDDFVRNFGNIQQMLEFTTSGKFKENNRFAGYVNLPELVRIWSGVSDTVLTKEAGGVSDKIPDMEGGKAQDLYLPQTRALRSIMKYVKAELERYDQMSGKQKKENSHIPLTMYGIAKAAAVDARLVQSDAEDDTQSKTNEAVRQTLRSLKESADYKGTVAIFADNYQNKESGFNLYEDIRTKLIAEGVPADEIVVIKSGMTVKKKLEIFEKVNRGEIRVILGSTFTLGTGVNIQERLYTLIHLDAPNRPMDYTQRNGRILRQGNLHKAMGKAVRVLRFGVEDSLDVTAYQRLKTKGAIADSIMNGKQMMANSMTNRVLEEEEDVFGDTVAQLSGSEYAMLKNNAEKNVRKYASRKKQWEADQTYIHNAKPRVKAFIKDAEKRIDDNSRYLEAVRASFPDGKFKEIVIGKHRFATVEAMEDFFKEHNKSILAEMKQMKDGEIAGEQKRELTIQIGDFSFVVTTKLTRQTMRDGATLFNDVERKMTYSCAALGIEDIPVRQNLLRNAIEDITNNVITGKDFAERVEIAERVKKHNEAELEQLLSREGKPFEYEAELEQAQTQYEEFSELMKKELEEKEAKYAEMDATVEAANDLDNAEEDDTLYRSDDATKNRIEALFNQAILGEFKGKPISIGRLTDEGKAYLEQISGVAFKDKVDFVLNPSDLVHIYNGHFGNNETDERSIPLDIEDIRSIADVVSFPDRIIYAKENAGEKRKMFFFLKEADNGAYNLLEIYADKKGNLTAKTFYKTKEGVSQRAITLSKSLHTTSETYGATLNDGAKIPQMFETTSVEDNYSREGDGAYTDDEVSFENDPISKVLGKPRFTRKQRREFAERERQRMVARVENLAKKLNLDNVEIITDASTLTSSNQLPLNQSSKLVGVRSIAELEGKKQRAKGFYTKSTGKITIVIPNHSSTFDVEQTLLHEAVAHYGLRQLFGEHFDTFLDNVFNNADEAIRQRIVALAAKNGWDFHKATEEYLAMLAENTEFENTNASWWRQIKDFFLNMLHKIGFEDLTVSNHLTLDQTNKFDGSRSTDGFRGVTLTDNELRYILWRSYENLAEPGKYRSILGEAADVAKQYELGVGNYAVTDGRAYVAAEDQAENIEAVNARFNAELQQQIDGTLPTGHIYQLGMPGEILRSTGIADAPIQLNSQRLMDKSSKFGHNFDLSEVKDLVRAINNPIAIFRYGDKTKAQNVVVEIQHGSKNFIVGISIRPVVGGNVLDINSIRNVFPKDNAEWLNWITEDKALYLNKEKIQDLIDQQRTNLADVEYLDLDDVANILESFENPQIPGVKNDEEEVLFRNGDPEIHERALARDRYERRVKTGMFQSQEALQDSMLGLKEAMQAILGKKTNIEDVDGFENAYLGENRLSSVNKAEADAFAQTLFKPMLDEVAKLARNEAEREELTDYMMAKHGLERNAYMRNEAIKNGATDADQTDYAGLTALTGMDDVADAEAEAQRMIDDYEQAHDPADLWEKVNAVSKAILQKSYECGMMSKETFDKVSDMYEFYIPLRGFDEKTSAEAYAYLSHKHSAFNAPIKKAEGRRSKADDPFANLQSMAEGAIMQGNRNKLVKQRFLNFALNHPSDLVSVSDIWVEYDAVTDEWKPVFPDNIESTDTPEEVEQKMQDFETKMESLAQQHPDQYKRGKDAIGIPYRIVESRDMRQHQVVVKRGGRDYVITINGNPRAAQALNGQTNPDNDMSGAIGAILRAGEKINRQLSAFYTTRNPDFIVSNFMRDMLYTNSMAWIKESPNYALRFHRNYLMVNPVTMKRLLAKYRKGTLDMSNKTEAMFHQFMMNGGETGYANIRDIEQHKNDIRKELKRANGKLKLARAWSLLAEKFDELNRAVENCARFAAFVTSREMGRSIDRAIYDAKEISVNFNKKGSGSKFLNATAQTRVGNASAFVSGIGRSGCVFWNAAIQGTTNFGRQMKRHPAKAFTGMAAMFLLGAIVAYFGGDDDEDDKNAYYNLPEYVRRSNILFRAGDSWISIPLPIEYRAFYGMGELMTSVFSGKEHLTGGEIAEAIAGQATQILPLDFLEGGGGWNAFVPSAAKPIVEAYVAEKSWTGMPLYKDTPFNKDMPEWTKAYKSANKHIVNLAATLNEATGGDPYTKGAIDINPAKVEYMLNGYFGGVFGTIDKLVKMGETAFTEREYDHRNFLLVNRLVKAGDERTEYRAVNNEYFRLKEEHDRLKTRLRHYEEDTDNGIFDYAEKIDFLYNSPEYERYEIFEDYRKDIDDLYDEMQEAVDDEERKDIEAELNELKKEMIQEMNTTR